MLPLGLVINAFLHLCPPLSPPMLQDHMPWATWLLMWRLRPESEFFSALFPTWCWQPFMLPKQYSWVLYVQPLGQKEVYKTLCFCHCGRYVRSRKLSFTLEKYPSMSLNTEPLNISLKWQVMSLQRVYHPHSGACVSYQDLQCTSHLFLSCPVIMMSLMWWISTVF